MLNIHRVPFILRIQSIVIQITFNLSVSMCIFNQCPGIVARDHRPCYFSIKNCFDFPKKMGDLQKKIFPPSSVDKKKNVASKKKKKNKGLIDFSVNQKRDPTSREETRRSGAASRIHGRAVIMLATGSRLLEASQLGSGAIPPTSLHVASCGWDVCYIRRGKKKGKFFGGDFEVVN